jgi:hypothetical protein
LEIIDAGLSTLSFTGRNVFFHGKSAATLSQRLLIRHIDILRSVVRVVREKRPFVIPVMNVVSGNSSHE